MSEEPVLELDDIQGSIIPGFKKNSQHFVFFRVTDTTLARGWLKTIASRISSAQEVQEAHKLWKHMRQRQGEEPDNLDFLFLSCAFSAEALRKLGIEGVDQFDDAAFKIGLERRAGVLGDPPAASGEPGSPDTWLFGAGSRRPDVLLILATDDYTWAEQAERELISSAQLRGLQLIHADHGRVRPGAMAGHEHFGFRDGISHTAIRGRMSAAPDDFFEARTWPPDRVFDKFRDRYAAPGRQLVWPGHFLFGYPRQDRDAPDKVKPGSEPTGPAWAKNGSFLVYRRLNQDVTKFQNFIVSSAASMRDSGFAPDLTPERLGAILVGRWASGWPVMRDPEVDRGSNQVGENYFGFSEALTDPLPGDPNPLSPADSNGLVCPFFSHIRKVQPRDDPTDIGPMERTFQKLLLRRGITFGPEMEQPEKDRGLLFVAFQSSIVDQFEFLMNDWVNDANKPHSAGGIDPIIGSARNATVTLSNGTSSYPLVVPGGWVFATGGEYMFAPGINFFRNIL